MRPTPLYAVLSKGFITWASLARLSKLARFAEVTNYLSST